MKAKYLSVLLAIGIISVGSFSVFAQTTNVEKMSANVVESPQVENNTTSNLYEEIKEMIDQQVATGQLTEEEGQALLEYCSQQMNENCNTNTEANRQANGCH